MDAEVLGLERHPQAILPLFNHLFIRMCHENKATFISTALICSVHVAKCAVVLLHRTHPPVFYPHLPFPLPLSLCKLASSLCQTFKGTTITVSRSGSGGKRGGRGGGRGRSGRGGGRGGSAHH